MVIYANSDVSFEREIDLHERGWSNTQRSVKNTCLAEHKLWFHAEQKGSIQKGCFLSLGEHC